MKLSEFIKSKRTWTIIGGGVVSTIAALFPEKFQAVSTLVRAIFGIN